MTDVECLFEANVDAQGYVHWHLVSIGEIGSGFYKKIVENEVKNRMTNEHSSSFWPVKMTKDNNYTYHGYRKDCPVNRFLTNGPFFGFIVERIKLNKCKL